MAELGTALLLMAREDTRAGSGVCVVAESIEQAVERHRHLIAHKPVEVVLQLDRSVTLPADPALLDILIGNLVRNAFSYTDSGTVTLQQDSAGFSVADTGRGMSEQAAGQAFLRHFRDMASTGAGIGLALVKRICDQQGWQVRLESRPGEGTRVTVRYGAAA
jgi:signal transduction histidine kinase